MNHDRVPQCVDYFVEGRDECLVMTYIQGSTVEQLLFFLYSSYMEEDEQEEHPWEEELDLHPATVNLLNLLLKRESEDDAVYQRHIEQACEALEVNRYSLKQALCGPNVQSKVDTQK